MMQVFEDLQQGTDEWRQIRAGLPTASMFSAILAKGEGKTRRSYLYRLAAEIITGEPTESFTNGALERGKAMEAEARATYCLLHGAEPKNVGFIKNGNKGCSPDSLLGTDGVLEIKTQRADLLIETIFKDEFPSEHKAQSLGNIWIAEREWLDIAVYWPRMPLFTKRIFRDDVYIAKLAQAVDEFNDELAATVDRLRRYEEAA
jgi:hypothetical protein